MATDKDATRSRLENIKAELRTISTCTATTVEELQHLLEERDQEPSQKENIRSQKAPLRSGRRTAAAAAAAVTTRDDTKTNTGLRSSRERYILATEVANIALKSLADALKSQPPAQAPTLAKAKPPSDVSVQKPARPRPLHTKSYSVAQPLKERSVGQVINSPKKSSSLRRSSSYSSFFTPKPDAGLVATAECARIAFAYLRSPEAVKVAGKDTPALQLESGSLALIGKLVAHSLDSLAMKEMRTLKKRLEKHLGSDDGKQKAKPNLSRAGSHMSCASDKESLAELLDFGNVDRGNVALPMITNFQTYVLRIISRIKRPRIVEASWNYLKLSNPGSPANLIYQLAQSTGSPAKAARQLESLAQTIFLLCPGISSNEDNESPQLSPDIALCLQHLAFRVRQRWWKLAKHQVDREKELDQPFSKYLAVFARRSQLAPSKKYKLAESLYTDLLGASQDSEKAQQTCPQASQTLSLLAQAAGLPDAALRHLGTCSPTAGSSAAKEAARLARIATVSLESCLNKESNAGLDDNIAAFLEASTGELSGSAADLNGLFLESNALRRAATRILSTDHAVASNGSSEAIESHCFRVISACLRFTLRFLGDQPPVNAELKTKSRYTERLELASKLMKSTVDSVLVCCKRPLTDEHAWLQLDALIQDCLKLLQQLGEVPQEDQEMPSGAQCLLLRFSNAYWAIQSQLRKVGAKLSVVARAMQRSTELLRGCSEGDFEVLAMKFERYGDILDQLERPSESRDALLECTQRYLAGAPNTKVDQLAAKYPVQRVFEGTDAATIVGRALKSLHRSFTKYGLRRPDEVAFFDNEKYLPAVRGAWLEWQLALYQKTLSRNRHWDAALKPSLQTIAHRLMDLYTAAQFPVRRQRSYLSLLQLSLTHPDILSEPPSCQSIDMSRLEESDDHGLKQFAPHLNALCNLKHCLTKTLPAPLEMRECFKVWEHLVYSAKNWNDLAGNIDNTEDWLQELQASVDYLAAKGEEYLSLAVLQLVVRALELQGGSDMSELVSVLCKYGLQLLRLGYSGKAGLTFAKAEVLLSNRTNSTEAKLHWHLGYAEYLLRIGNVARCESVLSTAHSLAQEDKGFMDLTSPSTTLSGRMRFNRILADACFVSSLVSTHAGNFKLAARYARQSVMLNRHIWAALEARSNAKKASAAQNSEATTFDPLSSMRTEKGTPVVMSVTHNALDAVEFWPIVPCLYRALMQHSFVFAQQGLFQEASYVAEQAEKVAAATSASSLLIENTSRRIEQFAESGRLEKAQAMIDSFDWNRCGTHISSLAYHSSIAKVHHLNREFNKEIESYNAMERILADLIAPEYIKTIDSFRSNEDILVAGVSKLSLNATAPTTPNQLKTGRSRQTKTTRKVATKPLAKTVRKPTAKSAAIVNPTAKSIVAPPQATEQANVVEQCVALETSRQEVILRKVMISLQQHELTSALEVLDTIQTLDDGEGRNISHIWVRFKALLSQAMSDISEDFTFNGLPESTIAFPAVPLKPRQSSEGAATKRPATVKTAVKASRGKAQTKEAFAHTLQRARDILDNIHVSCATTGSNHSFQNVSAALGHVTVLLSALSGGLSRGHLHPLYAAYMSEVAKCKTLKLAQESIEVEQENMSREDCFTWPEFSPGIRALSTPADFQHEYVNIIPKTWTAVSLALNDEQDELFITRFESGTTPFILRLPLARHSSRDMDEEIFTFADGRQEFEKIIEDSDLSTRSAKDMTTREARLEWWEARELLDTQLHELLVNMENIWLGGFKGVFSQHARRDDLLARFRTTLDNILNRHLPSRRKRGAQKKSNLDARVLDLFVGLGDPSNQELDLDDTLVDLLYFVVDILQFNGERNAYDEIDFDAMVIETLDALRAYHAASRSPPSSSTHMILILDKNLHMFPWESLPCLQNRSISRLPSLAALRERILAARPPSMTQNAQPGHYIPTESGGTSILNPSGDLTHTQKMIKPHLDNMLGSWTHIANRPPTEKEFEDSLGEKDLVLYFGHGSGAQFVRSKAVRRLYLNSHTNGGKPGCATTFLFGCSSVHLSDNGIYEPSGMLASYLTAGAPAVLGMLWDVTDKDCDRFAVRTGELWGLWPEAKEVTAEPPPTVKKSKGKSKVAQLVDEVESARGSGNGRRGKKTKSDDDVLAESSRSQERRRGIALDEAVKDGRKVCVLRYLNGAAAVVYGIPVYLE